MSESDIEAEIVQPEYPETAPYDEQRRAWIFTWWSVHGFQIKDTLKDCREVEKYLIGAEIVERKPKLEAVK